MVWARMKPRSKSVWMTPAYLRRGGADRDGPGAHFLHAGGEVSLQAEQGEGAADQAVQARFFHAHVRQEGLAVFLGRSTISDSMAAQMATMGALRDCELGQALEQQVVGETVVADVAHVRMAGLAVMKHSCAIGAYSSSLRSRPRTGSLVELGDAFLQHGHQALRVLVAGTGDLGVAVQGFLGGLQVGQRQFGLDDFDVGDGVDLAGDVDHVRIFEAAHHVDDGVGFRGMCERNWLPGPR